MNQPGRRQVRQYIEELAEQDLWWLLVEYFQHRGMKADVVHGTGEHGMDVLVVAGPSDDNALGIGYNIAIQAKTGGLGLGRWRHDILYQLLEAPYFTIPHPSYNQSSYRRILLVVTGAITHETRVSIAEFNNKHEVTIELWSTDDLLNQMYANGFADSLIERFTTVGHAIAADIVPPPAVGEDNAS